MSRLCWGWPCPPRPWWGSMPAPPRSIYTSFRVVTWTDYQLTCRYCPCRGPGPSTSPAGSPQSPGHGSSILTAPVLCAHHLEAAVERVGRVVVGDEEAAAVLVVLGHPAVVVVRHAAVIRLEAATIQSRAVNGPSRSCTVPGESTYQRLYNL